MFTYVYSQNHSSSLDSGWFGEIVVIHVYFHVILDLKSVQNVMGIIQRLSSTSNCNRGRFVRNQDDIRYSIQSSIVFQGGISKRKRDRSYGHTIRVDIIPKAKGIGYSWGIDDTMSKHKGGIISVHISCVKNDTICWFRL